MSEPTVVIMQEPDVLVVHCVDGPITLLLDQVRAIHCPPPVWCRGDFMGYPFGRASVVILCDGREVWTPGDRSWWAAADGERPLLRGVRRP